MPRSLTGGNDMCRHSALSTLSGLGGHFVGIARRLFAEQPALLGVAVAEVCQHRSLRLPEVVEAGLEDAVFLVADRPGHAPGSLVERARQGLNRVRERVIDIAADDPMLV